MKNIDTRRAMLSIMMYMAVSDGEFHESELQVAFRYFLDKGLYTQDELKLEIKLALEIFNSSDINSNDYITVASRSLPENLRKTAYALALDIAFSDGQLQGNEVLTAGTLANILEIPDDDMSIIMSVITVLHDSP